MALTRHRPHVIAPGRRWVLPLIVVGLVSGVGVVAWSPLIMYRLLGDALPWATLANVGEAYGGASALLSAAALCAIGVSLVLQSRQMRRELLSLDKQRHFDLVKLALENPEFFEVMDGVPVEERDGRQRVYANLTLNYWLALWELNEIDEPQLRMLTANMFRSSISRDWWRQVHGNWTAARGRRRQQFIRIVHEEWTSAVASNMTRTSKRPGAHSLTPTNAASRYGATALWCAVAVGGAIAVARRRRATDNGGE
jgi:hypothetical protein